MDNEKSRAIGIMPYDREKVLTKLKQKKYDDIFLQGRGRLDDFIGFLYETGSLSLFAGIDSPMQRQGEIPREFLHYCLTLKPVIECASVNQLPGRLFEDVDTLRELGFTMIEIEDGFSVKNKKGKNVPVNLNAFYDELARLPETETNRFFQVGVKLLDKQDFFTKKKGIYAIDAMKLLITGTKKYQGYGCMPSEDKSGGMEYGYKLVLIQRVDGDDRYIVAARLIPLNENEITVAQKLVEEAISVLGEGRIGILLFDRGFLSGEFFDFLGSKKIDFVCPTREDMHLTRYMQGLHRTGEEVSVSLSDGTVLAGYDHLIRLDSCKRKINGVLIIKQGNRARKKVKEGKEFGFITSLPASHHNQFVRVYNLYSRRWKIEVNGNRELKSSWYINRFPSQKWNGLCTHIYFTLFMFNAVAAFRGRKGRMLAEKGILSLRNKYFAPFEKRHMIGVIADGYCATISLKELLEITGLPASKGKHKGPIWVKMPNGKKELWVI